MYNSRRYASQLNFSWILWSTFTDVAFGTYILLSPLSLQMRHRIKSMRKSRDYVCGLWQYNELLYKKIILE